MKKIINKIIVSLCLSLTLISGLSSTVSANEYAKEPNKLTIISSLPDGRELLGFEYKVINKETNEEQLVSLKDTHVAELSLPDGTYIVKEVTRPEGYKEMSDREIMLPFPNSLEKGTLHKEVKFYTKHQMIEAPHPQEEPPKETPNEEPPKETPRENPPKETPKGEIPKETPKEKPKGPEDKVVITSDESENIKSMLPVFIVIGGVVVLSILNRREKEEERI